MPGIVRLNAQDFLEQVRLADHLENGGWFITRSDGLPPVLQITINKILSAIYQGPCRGDMDPESRVAFSDEVDRLVRRQYFDSPIVEPVDKRVQSMFVQAEHNLMWLAEHGQLERVATQLANMRSEVQFQLDH